MLVERITISNFRCFGPEPTVIEPDPVLTAFVGNNGTGKTAAIQALLRLFSVNPEQRRVRVQDFHVPVGEDPNDRPDHRRLSVDVLFSFPELGDSESDLASGTIPEFFRQMSCNPKGVLKLRIQLVADWISDGSLEGDVTELRRVVRTLRDEVEDDEWSELGPADRSQIQMIYVPVMRDGARHVEMFLKGRIWRAAQWTAQWKQSYSATTQKLNEGFVEEPAVTGITEALRRRWSDLNDGGIDSTPSFRPISEEIGDLAPNISLYFEPTETGAPRPAAELSDGQRSLLHLALTAAALDIEVDLAAGLRQDQFSADDLALPHLTLLAVEEPENSLSPYFLSRIVEQMHDVGGGDRSQAIISSHAPSVMARVEPTQVRHFRRSPDQPASVGRIPLPSTTEDASKYVREAVRRFPEMYFARFVVLGEGSSETVAIPIFAEARNLQIDQSFVAVVPLGGRHVSHMWRLLKQLNIPYATLLDLDLGRAGAGKERIAYVVDQLHDLGVNIDLPDFEPVGPTKKSELKAWVSALRKHGVYFCDPLDLDWTLLTRYRHAYQRLPEGLNGPGSSSAESAVLGENGDSSLYGYDTDDLRWYRYLFLGRSKPSTHMRVLTDLDSNELRDPPEVIDALLNQIEASLK